MKQIIKMKESKTKLIGGNYYCAYCGNEALKDSEWDEYTLYTTEYCTCEGAQLFMEAQELLKKAEKFKDKKKLDRLKYNAEVNELKYKYGINNEND